MKAGRELDALVAEKVMGWEVWGFDGDPGPCRESSEGYIWSWRPSTDIKAAWEVVERLGLTVTPVEVWFASEYDRAGGNPQPGYRWVAWKAMECAQVIENNPDPDNWTGMLDESFPPPDQVACTAPLAICLAALKAVGVEVPA